MAILFQYSLVISIPLVILWLAYHFALSKIKHIRCNRIVLMSIYVFCAVLYPLLYLLPVKYTTPGFVNPSTDNAVISYLRDVCSYIWLAGAIACFIFSIVEVFRIRRIIKKCNKSSLDGHKIYVSDDNSLQPFSIGNIIVLSSKDYSSYKSMIICHELRHCQSHHTFDLIIAQLIAIICWYNPVAWLLRKDLKEIHEFEADNYVLESGYDAVDYQMMLLEKTTGYHIAGIANNLNYSHTRRRISMMNRPSTGGISVLFRYAVPVLGLAVALTIYQMTPVNNLLRLTKNAETAATPLNGMYIKVDGKIIDYDEINEIPSSEIKTITINKNDNSINIEMK